MSEGLRSAQASFKIVTNNTEPAESLGKALVFGHFPPVSTGSSQMAAATLWMLEASGYQVRSATGPGLSLAAQNVNFTSETRFSASTAFLERMPKGGFAVVHSRALEFSRIAKPTWYKRRMEELRRMRLLARIVARNGHTALVLDGRGIFSREAAALALGAVAGLAAGVFKGRGRLSLMHRTTSAEKIVHRLLGSAPSAPSTHIAEERAYRAAFDGNGRQSIRLTAPRAEQIARFAAAKIEGTSSTRLVEDVALLCEIVQRHDLRDSPLFRLVDNAAPLPEACRAMPSGPGLAIASEPAPEQKFAVPVTRYMIHLRDVLGLASRFPLTSRSDARRFLNWYVSEGPGLLPAGWVPVSATIRSFLRSETGMGTAPDHDGTLAHLHGHDARPFPLSDALTANFLGNPHYRATFDLDDPVDRLAFAVRAVIEAEDDTDTGALLGAAARRWFMAPVGGVPSNVSRFVFLMALQARFELTGRGEIDAPWASPAIAHWARILLADHLPSCRGLLPSPPSAKTTPTPDLRLVGLPRSGTGVGNNLLMSRAVFRSMGLEPQVIDMAEKMRALPGKPPATPQGVGLKNPLVLHHVNADRIPQSLASLQSGSPDTAIHVGFLLWEFDRLPKAHHLALRMLDEIWAPSRFVQETYARAKDVPADVPVIHMGKAITLPDAPKADLAAYGIPAQTTTFLTCFDFHSSLQRKNPLATVEAFLDAFAGRNDVRLIVKTTPPAMGHWGDPEGQWSRISALAARDPRILLRTDRLPFSELVGLVAAVDCLVSSHRAEGFGLLPAYALSLATPVIATDYSGTSDFCSQATAMTIPYSLVPVSQRDALFPMDGAHWAEIDRAVLAKTMRDFADDPMDGRLRAARGRNLMQTHYSAASLAARYRKRLVALGLLEGEVEAKLPVDTPFFN